MPAAYQHLRVRLRLEQTRFLNWGEKIGLVEEMLHQPSRILMQNRNVIIDLMLEIQTLFRDATVIESKFDSLAPARMTAGRSSSEMNFERRFPKGTNTMLNKTLSFLEKAPQYPKKFHWALVKQDYFEGLIEKLIGYNNAVEALLDSSEVQQLKSMQVQTYMAILQLNSNVDELKQISMAMQVKTTRDLGDRGMPISRRPEEQESQRGRDDGDANLACLADFKAQQISLEEGNLTLEPVDTSEVVLREFDSDNGRCEAFFRGKHVWIEWKHYDLDNNPQSTWNKTIRDRIKKLAILLGSENKPKQFGAPHCLGYFDDKAEERYGFLFAKPTGCPATTQAVSLLELITFCEKPSLTKRIVLAHALASCVMYLHSVNWLHKGIRSNNVIFFTPDGTTPQYSRPLIAGFEYARPDLPEEETEPPPHHSEHDIYRHPALLAHTMSRSQKSHDIYSLGIVLVEIAYWKSIDEIMQIPKGPEKAVRSRVRRVRGLLLQGNYMSAIEGEVGEAYGAVVKRCLAGGEELGIEEDAQEMDVEVGAHMQGVFSEHVVNRLGDISI